MPTKNAVTKARASEKNVRNLKVKRTLREYRKHNNTVGYDEIPEIRLSGYWLEDLGFLQGMRVLVITEKGSITIQLINEPAEAENLSRA